MSTFLTILICVVLALALVGLLADRRAERNKTDAVSGLALLPGDFKYESPNGSFRVYFPIATSIIVSIVLTLALRLFS